MPIRVNDLTSTVAGILDDYAEDVSDSVERAVEKTSREALSLVRKKAPRRSGAYRKGWKRVMEEAGIAKRKTKAIIYNATHGSLVHLIENGHQKAGGGRVEGIPHVKPTEEMAAERLPQLIKQELEGG